MQVSQVGFGSYRVDVGVSQHRQALRKALLSGVNLIDTSANYADGGSEVLIGEALNELLAEGELTREQVVVVSKAGYLQGHNFRMSQQRKQEGLPFCDLVEVSDGLEHCIHPEFLEDQLTASLERLQVETLDVYLLHNPEYFFEVAKRMDLPLEEARAEYERRIGAAFRHLETEVERGRIQWYGISSNTFPSAASEYAFTSLERVWEIAQSISPEHHFRVIQLPMNLLERGGVCETNQIGGGSVLEYAKSKQLGVLINRPLNAFAGGRLVRLADVEVLPSNQVEELPRLIDELRAAEELLAGELLQTLSIGEAERAKLVDQVAAGSLLHQHARSFASEAHWREVLGEFLVPTIQGAVQVLLQDSNRSPEVEEWVESYVACVNQTFQAVTALYRKREAEVVEELKRRVAQADAEWGAAQTLSGMALRALRSTEGVSTVLVGMRKEQYVEDVLAEWKERVEVRDRKDSWQRLVRT